MEIDFSRDKMTWTPLPHEPRLPRRLPGAQAEAGDLDFLGTLFKALGGALGANEQPKVQRRGFAGIELKDGPENPEVVRVLADGPAGRSGLAAGDHITHVQGRSVVDSDDVLRLTRKLQAGDTLKLRVQHGKDTTEVSFRLKEGL
jgi:S1-C subfamily serine protease